MYKPCQRVGDLAEMYGWSQWNLVAMGMRGFLLKLFEEQIFH